MPRERIHKEDISGQKFAGLRAIEPTGEVAPNRGTMWRCECFCGGTVDVAIGHLKRRSKKSCGCLNRSTGKKKNLCLT